MPNKLKTIDDWLTKHARQKPDTVALEFNNEVWSYEDFNNYVINAAHLLIKEFNVKQGDRIAYFGTNSNTEVVLFFACAKLGLIIVPLNWRLSSHELNEIMVDCNPSIIFFQNSFKSELPAVTGGLNCQTIDAALFQKKLEIEHHKEINIPFKTDATDPLFIVYTSGTTGIPKGAVLTQNAVQDNAIISVDAHNFTSDDHVLNVLPLFHVGGINIQMLPAFFIGARVTLTAVFDPETTVEKLKGSKISTMVCVPTVITAISQRINWSSKLFPSLRALAIGSTDVPLEIIQDSHRRGVPMIQVYGATETGPVTIYQQPHEATSTEGSIGRAGKNINIKLMSEEGVEVPLGTPGEIWVKAPNIFSYYWNNPKETENALTKGWFKTGDLALQDNNGLYWFTERLKHVIISGGENIYPAEIERVLNSSPEVKECSVVGRKDSKWGEVPIAFIVPYEAKSNTIDTLHILDGKVAKFKHPKEVFFLDKLPRNAMGKVQVENLKKIASQD